MSARDQKRRRQTPESRFWKRCEGHWVRISLLGGGSLLTHILWVDKYSIGVADWQAEGKGEERLLTKRSIQSVKILPESAEQAPKSIEYLEI